MVSDIYNIREVGIEKILDGVQRFGAFRGLTTSESMKLRLLAEEMFSLTERLLNKYHSEFWMEAKDKQFELYLKESALMGAGQKEKLISVSSSQKNAKERGLFGKLVSMMENSIDSGAEGFYHQGFYTMGVTPTDNYVYSWSMRTYESAASKEVREEDWDGLEKSILAHIADDIIVGIRGNALEMVVKVAF